MPYLRRNNIQAPYQPYIQRGGGVFSAFADLANRYVRPWLSSAVKTAKSGLSNIAKSEATKRIVNKAKDAVEKGIYDAGGQILQGENVSEVLKNKGRETKDKLTKVVKDEAYRQGTALRKLARSKDKATTSSVKGKKRSTSRSYSRPPKKRKKKSPVFRPTNALI